MTRALHLDQFYEILAEVRTTAGGYRLLKDCGGHDEWPDRGIAFFFEPGEERETGEQLRCVWVGTHPDSTGTGQEFWPWLLGHKGRDGGGGDHRQSDLRTQLGTALLNRYRYPEQVWRTWGMATPANPETLASEDPLERDVTVYLGAMPFIWLEVPADESVRRLIVDNALRLLHNDGVAAVDFPSDKWLGRYAPSAAVRESGLWAPAVPPGPYEESVLDVLRHYARSTRPDRPESGGDDDVGPIQAGVSKEDREIAVRVLNQRLTPATLRGLVPQNMRDLVTGAERGRPRAQSGRELAEFLLDLSGADLLAQYEVREQLCLSLDGDELTSLRAAGNMPALYRSRRRTAAQVAGRKWYAGKWWPRYFAATMGFPAIFAGIEAPAPAAALEEVEAYQQPPELFPYQQVLRDRVAHLLQSARANRGILSLPTGAGKTRTAVEALVLALRKGTMRQPYILWVAQSDELCEQAIDAFRQVWLAKGPPGEVLRIHRVWGGRDMPVLGEGGVIVASIQKLYRASQEVEGTRELEDLGRRLGALVFDEAHHAIAPSYTQVLRALGLEVGRRKGLPVPLLGLTATPYRNQEETGRLVQRFQANLLVPWPDDVNPVEKLQEDGILARAVHRVVKTGRDYDMTEAERRTLETFGDLADSFVKRVGTDNVRNKAILSEISRLGLNIPTLFFGCSVEHACAMAVLLRRQGVRAAVVTSATGRAARRSIVDDFKSGHIQVLCNYGILTTGFDAPRVGAVVVARPTASVVLYEQMIGRGMRGPRIGGTEECTIVDFSDNLERFGVQMAHTRFAEYWKAGRGSPHRARGVTG